MLVGEIRSNKTNLKTDEHEDEMIESYRIALTVTKKRKNESDNELTFL